MSGGGGMNWDPSASSIGSYAKSQLGSGPHIDWNPLDSTPGKLAGSLGSAGLHAAQGNFGQAGSDLGDAGNAALQTGIGSSMALFAPTAGVGMLQNESNRNDPGPAQQAAAQAAQQKQQTDAFNKQQADQLATQQQQTADQQMSGQAAFNNANGLEDALRNAYQTKRKNNPYGV